MLPGINGFHATFGHIFFVSVFFTVLTIVLATVAFAVWRTIRDIRARRADAIRWHADFEDLAPADRRCRHEINGEIKQRTCPNAFDCCHCSEHPKFAQPAPAETAEISGLLYPGNRLYHRGHTWVEAQPDGTFLIGLDDLATRLVGTPDSVELPRAGDRIERNGFAWRMRRTRHDVRVLAPVDGTVVETGSADQGWMLRVRPDKPSPDLRHLLRGSEVVAWVQRELERVQMAFAPAGAVPALADGGVLMTDLVAKTPDADWDRTLGEVFLEP